MLKIAVLGITGRMGRAVARALEGSERCLLSGALASPSNEMLGSAVGDLLADTSHTALVTSSLDEALASADVAIDFTLPDATAQVVSACSQRSVPVVVCTTGFGEDARAAIDAAAKRIPVLVAANTSIGVSVLSRLAAIAAESLGGEFDVEIVEAHHAGKRDIPSGTALQLGHAIAAARGDESPPPPHVRPAGSAELRKKGEIGYSSIRGGDIAGEHTVIFAGSGERVELAHRVSNRSTFAIGAIRAACWLAARSSGRYEMSDALGL